MTETRGPAWQADIPEEPVVPPAPEPEPTYPRPASGQSIEDARAELRNLVDEFVRRVLAPPKPTMVLRWPLQMCIKAPPGTGKTRAITDRIMALLDAGKKVIFAVPTHALGEQIVRDLEAIGARVYRSRGAPDPMSADGLAMCLEKDRTVAIVDALGDAEKDACKRGTQICDFYEGCGFQRQKRNPPRIWVIAHELLYLALPDFIPAPDVVVIDESFSTKALNNHAVAVAAPGRRQVDPMDCDRRTVRQLKQSDDGRLAEILIVSRPRDRWIKAKNVAFGER